MKIFKLAKEQFERNYDSFIDKIRNEIADLNYIEKEIGQIKNKKVYMFIPRFSLQKKKIFILSGQHGEELGGPYGLLWFLKNNKQLLKQVAITFIPIVNIHGFETGERNGETGAYQNWFLDEKREFRELGKEADILKQQFNIIVKSAKDGFLNLHEDATSEGFYLYVLGDTTDIIVSNMLKAGRKYFDYKKDGTYEDNETYEIKNGIVANHEDGSLDDVMKNKFNIPITVTIETPQRDAELKNRAMAISDMAAEFVSGILKK